MGKIKKNNTELDKIDRYQKQKGLSLQLDQRIFIKNL